MATGCYTEPYLPASYKGVGFKALDTSSEHGRRGAEGEFPFGERTAYADLGRRIRRYSISARFDENTHVRDAALLIAAVETTGPGPLVHPTRGVIVSAACTSLRVRDNPETEQGVTYVDMEFVEANNWPNGLSLVGSVLGIAISPLLGQVRSSFTSRYLPASVPTFREAAVVQAAQDQITAIANQYASATAATNTDLTRNQNLIALRSVAANDTQAVDTTTTDRAIALGMSAVAQVTTGETKFNVFRDLANGAALTSTFAAPASTAENAVYNLVRTVSAIYMAEAALEVVDSLATDIFTRSDVIDAVLASEQDYARNLCDNELYLALETFRNDVRTQLNRNAYDAPGLIEFEFGGAVHPLQAAYEIYGDAARVREIETLNGVGRLGRVGPVVTGARVA